MLRWDQPLGIGRTDRYSVVPDDEWLDGETLLSATITTPDATVVTFNPAEVTGGIASALFTGVAEGYVEVTVVYFTATRNGCARVTLAVKDC